MKIKAINREVAFCRNSAGGLNILFAGEQSLGSSTPMVTRSPAFYLFHYITRGRGTVSLADGNPVELSSGDWFFCFPGQCIQYQQSSRKPWSYRWVAFQGEGAEQILAEAGIYMNTGFIRQEPDKTAATILCQMLEELEAQRAESGLLANRYLLDLLIYFTRKAESLPRKSTLKNTQNIQDYVEAACQFMINHFNEGITAADVASYAGFDRSYFSKSFSRSTGTSIIEYLSRLRYNKAKELLLQGILSVEEAALAVGYRDAKVFSRFFKDRAGSPPGQWRKQQTD